MNNLPRVTQLKNNKDGIKTHAVWLQSLGSYAPYAAFNFHKIL